MNSKIEEKYSRKSWPILHASASSCTGQCRFIDDFTDGVTLHSLIQRKQAQFVHAVHAVFNGLNLVKICAYTNLVP